MTERDRSIKADLTVEEFANQLGSVLSNQDMNPITLAMILRVAFPGVGPSEAAHLGLTAHKEWRDWDRATRAYCTTVWNQIPGSYTTHMPNHPDGKTTFDFGRGVKGYYWPAELKEKGLYGVVGPSSGTCGVIDFPGESCVIGTLEVVAAKTIEWMRA